MAHVGCRRLLDCRWFFNSQWGSSINSSNSARSVRVIPDPTDAELVEIIRLWSQPEVTGGGKLVSICKALRACRTQSKIALEVLQDWENTPGNYRDAAWWHEWERKRRAALDNPPSEAGGEG